MKGTTSHTNSSWAEAAKFAFLRLALNQTLVALLQGVEEGGEGDGVLRTSKQKLSLHLVNTSDPNTDVVIAETLLAANLAIARQE